jgi:prepilin-type processing-associated H-X9-DG protein
LEHSPYVYLGAGLKQGSNPQFITAYEKMTDHNEGCNVLMVDGSVHFINQNIDWRPDIEVNSVYEYWGAMGDGHLNAGGFYIY